MKALDAGPAGNAAEARALFADSRPESSGASESSRESPYHGDFTLTTEKPISILVPGETVKNEWRARFNCR
jgi:hypothetical protein